MPSALYLLNFVLLQWFFVRLAKVVEDDGTVVCWMLLGGIVPLTGWWSPYRRVWKKRG